MRELDLSTAVNMHNLKRSVHQPNEKDGLE
jgi:hypothetical protein